MSKSLKLGQSLPGILCAVLLILPACVTTQEDVLYLNEQIAALNNRLTSLEEKVNAQLSDELDSKLQAIRETQADTGAEMDRIREEMRVLTGRVEDNNELVRRTIEKDTSDEDSMRLNVTALSRRLDEQEATLGEIYKYLGAPKSIDAPGQKTPIAPVEGTQPKKEPLEFEKEISSPDKQLYELTLTKFKEGKYEEAIAGFEGFLEKHPKSDLRDNAQFWIGEAYMSLGQYEQAILAFQGVIKKYPNGNKVPNAMLRQALAFHEIDDKISAKLLLQKIIKNYPNSSEAKIAEAKLRAID